MKNRLILSANFGYTLTLTKESKSVYAVTYGKQVIRCRSFTSALREFSECAAHNWETCSPD